ATGELKAIDVSVGTGHFDHPTMVKWGWIGVGTGLATSAAATALLNRNVKVGYKYSYGKDLLIGTVLGGGLGVAYGATFPVEKWRGVPVPRRVSVAPTRNGASLDFALTY